MSEVRTEYKGKKVGDWIYNAWGKYQILEFLPDDKIKTMLWYYNENGVLVPDNQNPNGYVGRIVNYEWD